MDKDWKKFRYSLDEYISKTSTAYYVCYDSTCSARGNIKIEMNNYTEYR